MKGISTKQEAMYKSRHDVLIDALRPLLKICQISGEHAGVHILLTFRKNIPKTFAKQCKGGRNQSVWIVGIPDSDGKRRKSYGFTWLCKSI